MGISIASRRKSAHRMIARWGGPGFLIRDGVKRPITCAMMEYRPAERGLYLDGSVNIRISTIGLTVPPDFEQDVIQFAGKIYKINTPPTGPRPTGEVVYYDCNALYSSPAT